MKIEKGELKNRIKDLLSDEDTNSGMIASRLLDLKRQMGETTDKKKVKEIKIKIEKIEKAQAQLANSPEKNIPEKEGGPVVNESIESTTAEKLNDDLNAAIEKGDDADIKSKEVTIDEEVINKGKSKGKNQEKINAKKAEERLGKIKRDNAFIVGRTSELVAQGYSLENASEIAELEGKIKNDEERIAILKENPSIKDGEKRLKKAEENIRENTNRIKELKKTVMGSTPEKKPESKGQILRNAENELNLIKRDEQFVNTIKSQLMEQGYPENIAIQIAELEGEILNDEQREKILAENTSLQNGKKTLEKVLKRLEENRKKRDELMQAGASMQPVVPNNTPEIKKKGNSIFARGFSYLSNMASKIKNWRSWFKKGVPPEAPTEIPTNETPQNNQGYKAGDVVEFTDDGIKLVEKEASFSYIKPFENKTEVPVAPPAAPEEKATPETPSIIIPVTMTNQEATAEKPEMENKEEKTVNIEDVNTRIEKIKARQAELAELIKYPSNYASIKENDELTKELKALETEITNIKNEEERAKKTQEQIAAKQNLENEIAKVKTRQAELTELIKSISNYAAIEENNELTQKLTSLENQLNNIKTEFPELEKIDAEKKKQKEPEESKTIEREGQTSLDVIRAKYAEEYVKFMEERRKEAGFFNGLRNKILGDKVKDEEISEKLKNLENEYNKAILEYGNNLYSEKKIELSKSALTPEEQKNALEYFKQNEIFKKVILEEQEKLTALKAENLPPKEKSLLRKTFDLYMKQNRFTKVAVSVALSTMVIATFMPSMIGAGGVTAGYLTVKYGRALLGGVVGQVAAKGYDLAFEETYTARKELALGELKKKFGENVSEEDFSNYKKEYDEILEKEAKAKRNRLIHKALVAVAAGGLAAYEAGNIAQSFSAETALPESQGAGTLPPENHTDVPVSKTVVPEQVFKAEQVQFSSKGAIQTIEDLKAKIQTDYPDISKAPHSVQEFMKTNSTEEAIKLGYYDPNNPSGAESAMVLKGSTLGFDEHGNLIEHNVGTGENHTLITEQNNVETVDKFHGKMIDADKSNADIPQDHNLENQQPIKLDGATDHVDNHTEAGNLENQQPIKLDGVESGVDNHTPTGVNNHTGNLADQQPIKLGGAASAEQNAGTTPGGNQNGLGLQQEIHTATTLETLSAAAKHVYEDNIHHMFPDEKGIEAWNNVKSSTELHPAQQFILWKGPIAEPYEPLLKEIQTIHEVTGLSPETDTIPPTLLTPEEYIIRGTAAAEKMGPEYLEKIKYLKN